MFASEANVGIRPSKSYKFLAIACPSGAYFSTSSVKVVIQREYVRAVRGGTGNVKCGGNYSSSLLSTELANAKGFQQSMWLDAIERKYVEEMSGMNFCAVINDELVTPELTETILPGITRNSLLKLAPSLGIKTSEKTIEIEELIKLIKSGECSEAFCCGTAAIITPIDSLNEFDGQTYSFKEPAGKISKQLREALLALQETGSGDNWKWSVEVKGYE
jgi:branched-chain amino acid aminotransferase